MAPLEEKSEIDSARQELEIVTRTMQNLQSRLKDIDNLASSFASMSTTKKPSWVGIILILIAISIEILPLKILIPPSDGFTYLMFISGMISLGVGAALETLMAILRQRQIDAEKMEALRAISEAAEKSEGLLKRVWG